MTASLSTPDPAPAAASLAATNSTRDVVATAAASNLPTPNKTHLVSNPILQTSPSKSVTTVQIRFHDHLVHDAHSKKKKTKKTPTTKKEKDDQ